MVKENNDQIFKSGIIHFNGTTNHYNNSKLP